MRRAAPSFFVLLIVALTSLPVRGEGVADRPKLARFSLKTLDGKRFESSTLVGKVTVVSFWATWCQPCKRELSELERLRKQFEDRGLAVVAIATDGPETLSAVRSTVRRKRWRVTVLTDPDGTAGALLNPRGSVPYSIFVDRQGRVAHIHSGFQAGDESKYVELIERLLAEEPAK